MCTIISVHSFRRGTGKTGLAANLAALLAARGHHVGLLDLDLHSPTLHFVLGLPESQIGNTLNGYLRGQCALEHAVYDVTPSENQAGRLYLVPASTDMAEIAWALRQRLDIDALHHSINDLIAALHLDWLFIDTYAGLDEETLFALAIADCVFMLLHPNQLDYQGTAVMIDVARKLDVPKIYLVANEMPQTFDEPVARQQLERSLGCPVMAILTYYDELAALGSGDLMVRRYPHHPYTRRLNAVADQIEANLCRPEN